MHDCISDMEIVASIQAEVENALQFIFNFQEKTLCAFAVNAENCSRWQYVQKWESQPNSGEWIFLHISHQFCFESEYFLGNETLAHFWISFWIAPSPIPQHLRNETDCSLNPWGVAAFGGENG